MHIKLNITVQERIIAHLEGAFPNEGGGFLLGTIEGEGIAIHDIVPVTNTFAAEEQFHRYAMTPLDWARMEDEADTRELSLVGYFHSHPDYPAVPSVYDLDHALPNFTYIITAVYGGKAAEMRVWRMRPDRAHFDEEMLTKAAEPGTTRENGG